jgi:hypothetical protein
MKTFGPLKSKMSKQWERPPTWRWPDEASSVAASLAGTGSVLQAANLATYLLSQNKCEFVGTLAAKHRNSKFGILLLLLAFAIKATGVLRKLASSNIRSTRVHTRKMLLRRGIFQ